MSPFLPELVNDTFLHPEHHLIEQNFVPNDQDSSENVSTTKPPSLEFDQLNHTNPFDNYTSDAFGVIPLNESISNANTTSQEMQENITSTSSKSNYTIIIIIIPISLQHMHFFQVLRIQKTSLT